MADESKGFVFAGLGIIGGVVAIAHKYKDDADGSYHIKIIAVDCLLLFAAGAPTAFFVGNEMLFLEFDRLAFPLAYFSGILANEMARVAMSRAGAMLSLVTGGKL